MRGRVLQRGVFGTQVIVDVLVCGAKGIGVGTVGGGTRNLNHRVGPIRVDLETLFRKHLVGLHASILVAGTDDGKPIGHLVGRPWTNQYSKASTI